MAVLAALVMVALPLLLVPVVLAVQEALGATAAPSWVVGTAMLLVVLLLAAVIATIATKIAT